MRHLRSMNARPFHVVAVVLALLTVTVDPARAWDPLGAPICVRSGNQTDPAVLGVADGGLIAVWVDQRGANRDLYVQRLDANGQTHFAFAEGGVPLCVAAGEQMEPTVAPTPSGFAALWIDTRNGGTDLYALKCGFDGQPLPGWSANGIPVCTAYGTKWDQRIVERQGELYAYWSDDRNADTYVYARRFTSGPASPLPGGPNTGLPIVTGALRGAVADPDDPSGVFVLSTYPVVRVMRAIDGAPDPAWLSAGTPVSTFSADVAQIAAHANGGVIVVWFESGSIRAQRVLGNGSIAPGWPAGGVLVLSDPALEGTSPLEIACDNAGNTFITWTAGISSDATLQMTKLMANGALAPGWPATGLTIRDSAQDFGTHLRQIMTLCSSSVIVSWFENAVGSGPDIRVQNVSATGALQWGPDGTLVTTSPGQQLDPALASTGLSCGETAIVWRDDRSVAGDFDIYGAKLLASGQIVAIPAESAPPGPLSVRVLGANPSRGSARFAVNPGAAGAVSAEVLDVSGRQIRELCENRHQSTPFQLEWDGRSSSGATVGAGVYLARVRSGTEVATTRVILVH